MSIKAAAPGANLQWIENVINTKIMVYLVKLKTPQGFL